MPATIPNTLTNATSLTAAAVKANNEAVQNYINGSIVAADIDAGSVSMQSLARGHFVSSDSSHWFQTGDVKGAHKGGQAWERTYFTAQTKQIEDYTTTTQYIPISGTGEAIVLEAAATVFVHGYFQVVATEGSLNGNIVGKDHDLYYVIDSAIPSSYGMAFTEGATASANSGAVQGETPNNRRSYPIAYVDNLAAGIHNLYLSVNLNNQQAYISAYSWYIEIYYK